MSRRLFASIAMATAVVSGCQEPGATPPVGSRAAADTADQTLFGVRLVLHDHGIQRAVLEADTAFAFEDNTRTELRVVRSTFFTDAGVKEGTLTSREGTYSSRSGTMEARGNVIVVAEDGRRLETQQLRYDPQVNEISGDSAFVLTRPGDVLTGIGFKTDPNLTRIRVDSAASGRTTKSVAQPDR
jgi:LPS export ABC transporter protein LptC